jgi:opacity protein-like surface antigen
MIKQIAVKKIAIGSIAALCLCGGATTYAAEAGTYVGISFGNATIAVDEFNFEESDTGYKVYVGYTFNPYAAIELSYGTSGTPTLETPTGSAEVSATPVVASAIVSIPFQRMFAGFAKIGFSFYDSDTTTRQGIQTTSATDSSINLAYGIGASWAFLERYEVRIEYEKIVVDDGGFSMMSIGGVYRF